MCVVVSAEEFAIGGVLLVLVNVLGVYPAFWIVRVKIPPYLTLICGDRSVKSLLHK